MRPALTKDADIYKIKSVPFYAKGVAYDDEVRTGTSLEGFCPVHESVISRSGYSTVRLWMKETEDRALLSEFLTSRDCLLEFNKQLVAIAIPRGAFDEVSDFLGAEKDRGRWDVEDGYLVIDEPT